MHSVRVMCVQGCRLPFNCYAVLGLWQTTIYIHYTYRRSSYKILYFCHHVALHILLNLKQTPCAIWHTFFVYAHIISNMWHHYQPKWQNVLNKCMPESYNQIIKKRFNCTINKNWTLNQNESEKSWIKRGVFLVVRKESILFIGIT